jgi:hypothetical protein
MKKLLVGGLALGFAGIGTALIAAPGGAQEDPGFDFVENLDANLTPTTVQGGGTVTVTSVDACPGADEVVEPFTHIVWGVGSLGWLNTDTFEGEVVDEGEAPLNADGSWTVTLTAPSAPGDYDFFAVCATDDVSVDDEGAAVGDAAETLGGHHDGGDEPECPEPVEPQTLGGDDEGEECPPPCPEVPEVLGGGHDTTAPPSTECPPTTDTTAPPTTEQPPEEIGIWFYGPESFTVTQGAAPVPDQPDNFG